MAEITDFRTESTAIDGLTVAWPKTATDERGTVREFFRRSAMDTAGLAAGPWAQVNLTFTRSGGLRGMHAENMTKLIGVASGEVFGAWVDLRSDSPTVGATVTLRVTPGVQVLVPAGVANGFQAVVDTEYLYCFDQEWAPGMTGEAVCPLDPDLGFDWPIAVDVDDRAQISLKDLDAPDLADVIGGSR